MRAVLVHRFSTFDQAEFGETPDPVAGPGEVVVDLKASDVNFPDILYIEGKYQEKPAFPFAPGLGGAGVVSSTGTGAKRFRIGQKVVVIPNHGTYAEKLAVPEQHCFLMPEQMPFDVAAALTLVYQTAWFAILERGQFQKGMSVLVLGAAGGVGMAAVQIAKALGASCVIGATRGAARAEFVRKCGADIVLDSSASDLNETMRDGVMRATDGRGVDIVIDPVGGTITAAALRTLGWCGRLVVVGFAAGDIPAFRANYLLLKNITVCGLQWTDYRTRRPAQVAMAQQEIFDLWTGDHLSPHIAMRVPLADYASALHAIAAGKANGKCVLVTQEASEAGE